MDNSAGSSAGIAVAFNSDADADEEEEEETTEVICSALEMMYHPTAMPGFSECILSTRLKISHQWQKRANLQPNEYTSS